MQQSLQFIERHVCENIRLDAIAGNVFLSLRQFHRLFRKYTGKSPAKYIEERKMEKALQLLQQPETLITHIAYDVGYKNYETFSARFKRHFGISPGDLKNILNTVRLQKNKKKKTLNFHLVVSSDYNTIPEKLNHLKNTLRDAGKEMEAFVVTKNDGTNTFLNAETKYHLSKYNLK